eukprot:TRINITY_DN59916_c0_g1_i1.p2 TRINITY_DN59916_c0_g1~~TRINITY_DN59916_c0_g1_i1.p2  ORF type:complete len:395 (+),score=190.05 TRINITY_DN59916_c0_g1_i1:79-1185(+)
MRRPPLLPALLAAAALIGPPAADAVGRKISASEKKEQNLVKAEEKAFGKDLFPTAEGRERAPTIKHLGEILNASYYAFKPHIPIWTWRRVSTGCKFVRMNWREKQRGGMRDDPLMLPMRTVDGAGVKTLPIERLQKLKLYNRTVIRAWVDDDCWQAKRWVFIDLGARYMVRKKKPFFGSTFSFMCGYPGAERFEYFAFDINMEHYAPMFPPFVHMTTGAVWNTSGHIIIKGRAAGSFAEEDDDEGEGSGQSAAPTAPKKDEKESDERKVPAVDFADWLIKRVKAEDYVVVKMDIENAEFRVMDRMFETGAMELVDEVFIECHGELTPTAYRKAGIRPGWVPPAWVRSEACVNLETRLRRHGIYLHEWD